MKKRRFADGGSLPADDIEKNEDGSSKAPRFKDDVYARARAWQAKQAAGESDDAPAPKPKAAAKPPAKALSRPVAPPAKKEAPTPVPRATAVASGRAEIPVGNEKAPPKDDSFQPGEVGRNILNSLGGMAPGVARLGGTTTRGLSRNMRSAGTELAERGSSAVGPVRSAKAADPVYLKEVGMSPRAPRLEISPPAARVGMKPPADKVEMAPRPLQLKMSPRKDAATDAAEKTTRKATSRVGKGAKDRMAKKSPRKEEVAEATEYKKGGSVRGAGCSQRGWGKGSMR